MNKDFIAGLKHAQEIAAKSFGTHPKTSRWKRAASIIAKRIGEEIPAETAESEGVRPDGSSSVQKVPVGNCIRGH